MKHINVWTRLVNWFENGDLIPMLILVSVPHYAHVLGSYDFAVVAAVLGFLIDVGHYRTIKVYLNDKGAGWMIVLTLFSFGFHSAFYALGGAGWLSLIIGAAVPAVIFALSYISKVERLDKKAARAVSSGNEIPKSSPTGSQVVKIGNYREYVALNSSRNGVGPVPAKELVEMYGVPSTTAYRWADKYRKERGEGA